MDGMPPSRALDLKGAVDRARHGALVREALRQNLADLICSEPVVTAAGGATVCVSVHSVREYRFCFDHELASHVGQGPGNTPLGKVLGTNEENGLAGGGAPGPGSGGAGHRPGIEYYEIEVSVDELAGLLFEELELPRLRPKNHQRLPRTGVRYSGIGRHGPMAAVDRRRTALANLKRRVLAGHSDLGQFSEDDLRFRTWMHGKEEKNAAVVIAMRDVSASMGEFKKYISRTVYHWMLRFLRSRYEDVDIVFIAHHTEAREVDEEAFFHLGESGGTRVSSAYRLALQVISERYEPGLWNIYPFHFSDGDNWGASDNRKCVDLVRRLVYLCGFFGYGEINEGGYTSPLRLAFSEVTDPGFVSVVIDDAPGVYGALKAFFGSGSGDG